MLVLENSAGSGLGLGVDASRSWPTIAAAIASAGVDRAPGRVLPRHRACLGRRHRPRRPGRHRRVPDAVRRRDRPRAPRPRPPQRLALRARLADSIATSTSGAGRIGRATASAHLLRHPSLAQCRPTSSRRPAWTRGTTRSTWHAPRTLAAGRPLAPLPREAFELRGSRARTAPGMTAGDDPTPERRPGRLVAPRLPGRHHAARAAGAGGAARGSRTSRRAGRGTPTRATTCSCCASSSGTASIPLLGPPTSIGDVHHGAWYYYLLSPGGRADRRRRAARRRRSRSRWPASPRSA